MTKETTQDQNSAVPENAFRDLSTRSTIFRTKLIEEFQLLDNIGSSSSAQAPTRSSTDFADDATRKTILIENSTQLIKFKVRALFRPRYQDQQKIRYSKEPNK